MNESSLYHVPPFASYDLGRGRTLVVAPSGQPSVLDEASLRFLRGCRGAHRLDHLRSIIGERTPAAAVSTHGDLVEGLAASGLLVASVPPDADPRPACGDAVRAIATVGIVTAGRPQHLARCLASLLAHPGVRDGSLAVVDGSVSETDVASTREVVRRLAVASPDQRFVYVGAAEAAALRCQLQRRGIDRDVTEFALTPGEAGAGRNLLLALSAGGTLLMIDDDVLSVGRRRPAAGDGLEVRHYPSREEQHFGSRADALAATADWVACDTLAEHARFLGRRLGDLLRSASSIDLSDACPELLEALTRADEIPIRATYAGVIGDAGRAWPESVLFAGAPQREEAFSDAAGYETAMTSREVIRVPRVPAVVHAARSMAYCMGLDNSRPTAPYLPVDRNEDGLFGDVASVASDLWLSAHLSCGVVHDSARTAGYKGRRASARMRGISDVISEVAQAERPGRTPAPAGDPLARVAARLTELSTVDWRSFRDFARHTVLERRTRDLSRAWRSITADSPLDARIRQDLERYEQRLLEGLADPAGWIAHRFRSCETPEAAFRAEQAILGQFGRLLQAWPAIWREAADIGNAARLR